MGEPGKDIKRYVDRELRIELEDEADLYENAPCGYLSLLPDGTIIKINRTLLGWLGYDRDAVLFKRRFQDLVTVPGRIFYETHHFLLVKMQGAVKELNYEMLTSEQLRIPVLIHTTQVRNEDGVLRLLRMMVTDITDRKRYEVELLRARRREEEEKKRFRFMAEMAPVIIWTASASGIVDYVSKKLVSYTGFSFKRSVLPAISLQNECKLMLEKWKRCVREKMEFEMELQLLSCTGEYQWHLLRATPYLNEDREVIKWFGTCTNIHLQREMQEKMDEFLSIASHELKTPITSVKANLELLLLTEQAEQRKTMLSKAFNGTNKMLDLVNSLLDISKIQAGHIQFNRDRVEVRGIVDAAAESILAVYPYGKITISDKVPGTFVFADPARLEQVVANLLSNAIKYSPGVNKADVKIRQSGREVVISVQDHGIGIDQDKLDKVFNRFYRVNDNKMGNRFSGLGIGLYITRQIVMLQEGKIWVESKTGEGSTFFISFTAI